jgi:hypothetical protein
VKNWNTGKIAKTTVHQVKIIVHPANAWIGMKPRDNWIYISCLSRYFKKMKQRYQQQKEQFFHGFSLQKMPAIILNI